jgi:hypothetical protein
MKRDLEEFFGAKDVEHADMVPSEGMGGVYIRHRESVFKEIWAIGEIRCYDYA